MVHCKTFCESRQAKVPPPISCFVFGALYLSIWFSFSPKKTRHTELRFGIPKAKIIPSWNGSISHIVSTHNSCFDLLVVRQLSRSCSPCCFMLSLLM